MSRIDDDYQRTKVENEQLLHAFDDARHRGRGIATECGPGAHTALHLKRACDEVLASAAFRALLVKHLNDRLCRVAEQANAARGQK